jgi:hypothetical protein
MSGGIAKTAAQNRVLDEIGCGNYSPIADKRTIEALLKKGFIEELSPRIIRTGPFSVHVRQFQMPIHIHIQWCAQCEDTPGDPS